MADIVAELGIIAVFALLGGLLANRFRQPSVLGLLFAGALIGPNGLGLITEGSLIDTLAEVGAVLLLFTIGIEFSISKLLKVGMQAVVIATFKVAFVFVVTYEVALLLGLTLFEAFVLGAILAVTSTAIASKLMAERGLKNRPESKLIIATMILDDVFAVFLLTLFSSIAASGAKASSATHDLLVPFIISMCVLAVSYLVLQRVLKGVLGWILQYRTDESLVLIALTMAVGLSYGAGALGLAPSIGAFVAGSMALTLPGGKDIERSMKSFSAVFSALFFMAMGMLIVPGSLAQLWPLVLIFGALCVAAKLVGMGIGSYLSGMRGRAAVFAGIAIIPVGEFSLLLARQANGLMPFDIVGLTSMLVVVSTIATSVLMGRERQVHSAMSNAIPHSAHVRMHEASNYFGSVMKKFEPGGAFFSTFRREGRMLVANLSLVVLVMGAAALLSPYLGATSVELGGISMPMAYLLYTAALLIVIYPIISSLDALKEIFDELTSCFHIPHKDDRLGMVVLRDLGILASCVLLAVYMPLILSTLRLEGLWFVSLAPIVLAFMLSWEILKHVHELVDKRTGTTHSGKLGELVDGLGLPLLRFERLRRIGKREGRFVMPKEFEK